MQRTSAINFGMIPSSRAALTIYPEKLGSALLSPSELRFREVAQWLKPGIKARNERNRGWFEPDSVAATISLTRLGARDNQGAYSQKKISTFQISET
jgi:hypothetical protein